MRRIDKLLCLIGIHDWRRESFKVDHKGEVDQDVWAVFDVCHCGVWKFIKRNCYDGIGIQPSKPWPRE